MTPHPQQEYIITEGELMEIADHFKRHNNPLIAKRIGGIISTISSRPAPTPTPAAPEKPCDHCDFQEREEYIHTLETRVSTIRNQALDAVLTRVQNEEMFLAMAADNSEIYYLTGHHIRKIIESLRTPSTEENQRGDQR